MSTADGRGERARRSRALTLTAIGVIAVMGLSGCSSHVVASPKASVDPQIAAAAKKTAACARVVSIKSQLSDIKVQVFQTMSVGNESGVWGPIVMDLDRQKLLLNTEMTAGQLICGGPTTRKTPSPDRDTRFDARPKARKVNKAKLDPLTSSIAKNPRDNVALQSLADLYYLAGDYENASVWAQKILDSEPKNAAARNTLGMSQFSLGNESEAERQWRIAEWLYPNNVAVRYNLGYLYQNRMTPDLDKMRAEWKAVTLLVGSDSDYGRLVARQLK